ncbi:MAG: Na-translocating system protein MpsC family protein [Peptococcaceae bacterium]|nr:Na-translocating system protein MpsC family protein [Peptococcaceae bacterium]
MLMGEFKQEVIRINNKVNMEVFGQGLLSQRVEIFQDKILIVANNRRVKVLSMVDRTDNATTKLMDVALLTEFKERFVEMMEEQLGLKVLTHLKDYDPKLEISISVTILEKPVEELLPYLKPCK